MKIFGYWYEQRKVVHEMIHSVKYVLFDTYERFCHFQATRSTKSIECYENITVQFFGDIFRRWNLNFENIFWKKCDFIQKFQFREEIVRIHK